MGGKEISLSSHDGGKKDCFLELGNQKCPKTISVRDTWKEPFINSGGLEYLEGKNAKYLTFLSERLNRFHKKEIEPENWNILIGSWLMYFIDISFDLYSSIINAEKLFPDCAFRALSTPDNYPINSSIETTDYLKDSYGLFLLASKVCHAIQSTQSIRVKHVGKAVECPKPTTFHNLQFKDSERKTLASLQEIEGSREYVVVSELYCASIETLNQLTRVEPERYLFLSKEKTEVEIPASIDEKFRNHLFDDFVSEDEFDQVISRVLPSFIPLFFVENFILYETNLLNQCCSGIFKTILTAQSLYFSDPINMWMMLQKVGFASSILISQHGGGYGISQALRQENYERECSHRFITWGWRSDSERDLPLPAIQLVNLKMPYRRDALKILYIRTDRSAYNLITSAPCLENQRQKYHDEAISFIHSLEPELRDKILVKLHSNSKTTLKENQSEQFGRFTPRENLLLQDMSENFQFFIVDYPGTSFLQLISHNIPFIMIWDEEIFPLREEAQNAFQKLLDCKIVHKSHISAKQFLENNFDSLEDWWLEKDRQKTISEFSLVYCRSSPNFAEEWHEFLQSNFS